MPGIALIERILQEPTWLVVWVGWLVVVNTASVAFLRRREARWVLAAWGVNVVLMSLLHELHGYDRLLGISHLLAWTPLLAVLLPRGDLWLEPGAFGTWIRALMVSDLLSWVIDLRDVVLWLLGRPGP